MAQDSQGGSTAITKKGTTPIGQAKTTKPTNTSTTVKVKTIVVHIFFDGTRNNIYNSAAHRDLSLQPHDIEGEISYTNYYSNIALLYAMMEADDKNVIKIYVEGAGTTKYQEDSSFGLGMAGGATGRVERTRPVLSKLKELNKKNNIIVNVYGFSRGAAWARYFCSFIRTPHTRVYEGITINFVGILDTVSSDGGDHYDDVKGLGLDIGKPQDITYIFHLTAQNDYRYHFPLTPIRGAIKDGIGFECSLPGAHSDIGGGYPEEYTENKKLTTDYPNKEYIDYQWFVNKGYYTQAQLAPKPAVGRTAQEYGKFTQVYAKREVKFHYQFICFILLKEVAKIKAGYKERKNYSNSGYKNQAERNAMLNIGGYLAEMKDDSVLYAFYEGCYKYVMTNYTKTGNHKVPLLDDKRMKYIYGNYIHNSLEYGDLANGGDSNNKNKNDPKQPIRPVVTKGFRYPNS